MTKNRLVDLPAGHVFPDTSFLLSRELSEQYRLAIGDKSSLLENSKNFKKPFITKHNRGGRGLGVKYFKNSIELEKYINSKQFEPSIDGINLLQEYINSEPQVITRVEFVNSNPIYAVQVDATESFELCPADPCNLEDVYCPGNPDGKKFMIIILKEKIKHLIH